MAALTCKDCGIDWPLDAEHYQPCPSCRKHCIPVAIGDPLSAADAWAMKTHYEFDRWCIDNGRATLDQAVGGLTVKATADDEPVNSD
jgi:hypothetical protein